MRLFHMAASNAKSNWRGAKPCLERLNPIQFAAEMETKACREATASKRAAQHHLRDGSMAAIMAMVETVMVPLTRLRPTRQSREKR